MGDPITSEVYDAATCSNRVNFFGIRTGCSLYMRVLGADGPITSEVYDAVLCFNRVDFFDVCIGRLLMLAFGLGTGIFCGRMPWTTEVIWACASMCVSVVIAVVALSLCCGVRLSCSW